MKQLKPCRNTLTLLLVCLFLPSWISAGHAQQKSITLDVKDTPIKEILKRIEQQTVYTFVYDENELDVNREVDLKVTRSSITQTLDALLKDSNISYRLNDRQILLFQKKNGVRNLSAPIERRMVEGVVTDATDGSALIGATVVVKGEKVGVTTDVDGKFSISVPDNNSTIEVSYIGYQKREVLIGDLGFVEVKLNSDNELQEVIVVGAGTQKKVSVTGSITTVKGRDLVTPSTSLTTALAGKLAGVIATTTSGAPGQAGEFYIRGIGTFGGRSTPLILLDNVEITTTDLNDLPPETIESFSILKDASATAIYGVRGANGVLLITTKNGIENERARINATVETSLKTLTFTPKYADGATWMSLYNEAQRTRDPNLPLRFEQYQIDATRNRISPYVYPDVDWWDTMFKNMTMSQRANLNVQGGASKVTYYMSLQATHDTGIMKTHKAYSLSNNIDQWKYNFQANIKYKLTPSTTIDLHLNDQITNGTGPDMEVDELFRLIKQANPILFPAVFQEQPGDTHIRFGSANFSTTGLKPNPYAQMLTTEKRVNWNTINASLMVKQDFSFLTKGLEATVLVNIKDYSQTNYARSIEPYYYKVSDDSFNPIHPINYDIERLGTSGTEYIKEGTYNRNSNRTFMLQGTIDYNRTFGKHSVGGLLLYQQREYKNTILPNRNQSFSGRVTYDYDHRYLIEGNFAYNGTERLAKHDRFHFFPAVSIGWVISNESFFSPLSHIFDNLKLRTSYGIVGSDDTGLYAGAPHFLYLGEVQLNKLGNIALGDDFQSNYKGPYVKRYPVDNAGWELSKKLDIGLDMRLFNSIDLTFDYFYERRESILLHRGTWPVTMGQVSPWANVGKLNNWGVEVSTLYRKTLLKDLIVELRGNFIYTENRLVDKDEPNYPYSYMRDTGKPLNYIKGYVADGLFTSQEEIDNGSRQDLGSTPMVGDIKYKDLNGDGVVDGQDETIISAYNRIPRIQIGFGVNVDYKGWNVGLFFNGSFKRTLNIEAGIHPFGVTPQVSDFNIFQFIADDYWAESNPNPDARYPRLGINKAYTSNNERASTFWLRNGNFLRFKTLEIGYRFNRYCRVFFMGDNLAVFSAFKEWDPELKYDSYPLSRMYNLGLQLNF